MRERESKAGEGGKGCLTSLKRYKNVEYAVVNLYMAVGVWITDTGRSFGSKAVEAGALYAARRILAHVFAFACSLIATFHLIRRRFWSSENIFITQTRTSVTVIHIKLRSIIDKRARTRSLCIFTLYFTRDYCTEDIIFLSVYLRGSLTHFGRRPSQVPLLQKSLSVVESTKT